MNPHIRPAVLSFLALSLLAGLVYPLVLAGLAKAAFPRQAEGSLVFQDGRLLGSEWVGQGFTDPGHFWGRPSATLDPGGKALPWNAANSGGSNLSPGNPDLRKAVLERVTALQAADPDQKAPVPVDLVTASGSGLDPHISPAAAAYQVHRVAKARGWSETRVGDLVAAHTEPPQWGFLGEARVNVLKLNLDLDAPSPR